MDAKVRGDGFRLARLEVDIRCIRGVRKGSQSSMAQIVCMYARCQ